MSAYKIIVAAVRHFEFVGSYGTTYEGPFVVAHAVVWCLSVGMDGWVSVTFMYCVEMSELFTIR